MKRYDMVIIGAGAAGLFLGSIIDCKSAGLKVLIIEGTPNPGTKLLISGSGKCNLTNSINIKDFISHYNPEAKKIRNVLYRFSNLHLIDFFKALNVELTEDDDGKVFPKSFDSKEIRNVLLNKIQNNGIDIIFSHKVYDIEKSKDDYIIRSKAESEDLIVCASYLVIATGGMSYPNTGSDGSMFSVLEKLGIKIKKPQPALTPIFIKDYPFSSLSGMSFKNAGLIIHHKSLDKQKTSGKNSAKIKASGDLLFTHKNISGPVILNNSRYIEANDKIQINFLFPLKEDEVFKILSENLTGKGAMLFSLLTDSLHLPKRFVKLLSEITQIENCDGYNIKKSTLRMLAHKLTNWEFTVETPQNFSQAMATKGGVCLSQIKLPSFESVDLSGLYFIGEVLDVDGDTGGFNLQFAYSSAQSAWADIKQKIKI